MYWEGLVADWHLPPLSAEWAERPLREQVMARRGIYEEPIRRWYFHGQIHDLGDPATLPDIEKAIALLDAAIRNKQLIFIAGDYDVDGISSAAILATFLRERGVPYHVRLPDREEGYGLSPLIVNEAIEMQAGLFVSVDCGTKNTQEIKRLREAGIPTMICDHHIVPPDPADWPAADAFVNPYRIDAAGSYRELCAAGIVFKVIQAYLLAEGGGNFIPLEEVIDIVGVATLADVVPLSGENRLLSRLALHKLQTNPILGYRVLLQALGLQNYRLESRDIVFRVVPRLNAAGRLHKPDPALKLLLSKEVAEAGEIVKQLDTYNRERQRLQEEALREAQAMLVERYGKEVKGWPGALVVAGAPWHKGVIGLVAAKLTELYERPSAVLTRSPQTGTWVGSARSIEGVPLHEIIEGDCQPYLVKGGGHAMAAGFSVRDEAMELFTEAFIAAVERYRPAKEGRVSTLDGVVLAGQMLEEELDAFTHAFEPAGPGNPAPRYLLGSVRVTSSDGKKLIIHSVGEPTCRSFEGRVTFSSYRWVESWRRLLGNLEGIVVTPFRPRERGPVHLKVRDVIMRSRPAGQ